MLTKPDSLPAEPYNLGYHLAFKQDLTKSATSAQLLKDSITIGYIHGISLRFRKSARQSCEIAQIGYSTYQELIKRHRNKESQYDKVSAEFQPDIHPT